MQAVAFLLIGPALYLVGLAPHISIGITAASIVPTFAFLVLLAFTLTALGYLIAWPALFWMVGQSLRNRARREKWFTLVTISAALALFVWAAIYITRQPTTQEMERASMIALAVAAVFLAIFIMAQRHFHKSNGV